MGPPQASESFYDPDTPPPPPPKPDSKDPSRRGTPYDNGPPLPPLPQSHGPSRPQSIAHDPPTTPSKPSRDVEPPLTPLVQPPALEEGWLPAVLQDKAVSDLQSILADSALLGALACEHPSYAQSLVPLENALAANMTQVQQVQQTESHLSKMRDEVQALLLQHTTLSAQWRRKQGEMDSALEPWSPKSMYQRLVAGIGEQESLVKAVEESFLDGDGHSESGSGKATEKAVSDWIRRVRDGTVLLEKRREARARWDEGRVGGWR